MSSTDRLNNLLVAEDWQKIYQSFKNADFQSYDFENLRRTMIDYIRTNFPEDFNDYIESSEYLALIDLIAFVGQSIAFRVDLNARENFLELAERRESILRLSRLIGYNASRNIPASGTLKVTNISTTENVLDSNGRNMSGQYITWNDPSNPNWYDQFIKVVNAALTPTNKFGNPIDQATIYNIPTSQYRFNGTNTDVPVYGFSKSVSGRTMDFEITSTTFSGKSYVYEEPPKIGNHIACVYMDDGYGAGSPGTGFFFNFTQGSLNQGTFVITQPSSNQSVDVDTQNINNTDVWLYQLDQSSGLESTMWTQVPSLTGNNIIYNSVASKTTTIYNVVTKANDSISLAFGDGTFGQLPLGTFRVYYRVSNGLSYTINTSDIINVSISIPYLSAAGQTETLTLSLSLASSVQNSTPTESNTSIKSNAPATYYTQNRMVTGEDYNISPLSATNAVAKIKALNRTSSGISRYFDLTDPTGKYSFTNLYGSDGILYTDKYTLQTSFYYTTRTDIEGAIYNKIFPILESTDLRNFYYSNFINYITTSLNISWYRQSEDSNSSTGYVGDVSTSAPYILGAYTSTDLKYFTPGALVKFTAPLDRYGAQQYFDTTDGNKLKTGIGSKAGAVSYLWSSVVTVVDNGTGNSTGKLSTGLGPVTLSNNIPTGAVVSQVIPKFTLLISPSVIATMIDLVFANRPFGLRYDGASQSWQIVFEADLNVTSPFSLGNQGSTTSAQQDSSWMLLFTTNNEYYTVSVRQLRYVFESANEINFFFDSDLKIYDTVVSSVITDSVNILGINTDPNSPGGTSPFTTDLKWEVTSEFTGLDGYIDPKKVLMSFTDSDNNGVVDNPQLFVDIVGSNPTYIVQKKYLISAGQEDYKYVPNNPSTGPVIILDADPISITQYADGQYFYNTTTGVVKKLNLTTGELDPSLDYKVYTGRDNLKFQYTHSADYDSRIDPGASNIMDVYVLTTSYDTQYRQWLAGANVNEPLPPSSDELYNILSPNLNLIKSISDEIVYHPVSYKLLFGANADPTLQANFNVTVNPNSTASKSDIIARILTAINQFFTLDNWNFGDTFYFSELATYVIKELAPDVTNFVIVPIQVGKYFGGLFEIQCPSNQIFISSATAENIVIVSGLTSENLKTVTGPALATVISQNIVSSTYGASNG